LGHSYTIAYASLPLGKHEFDFRVDRNFFARFEGSELSEGEAEVHVEADKLNDFMRLQVSIDGEIQVVCDRCLDEFFIPVEFDGEAIVNFDSSRAEAGEDEDFLSEEEEVFNMRAGDTELDFAQYIYESICLSLPLQRLHPDDENGHSTCNKAMLAKLREYSLGVVSSE
jgi:uncharacterized metal-binding protein YceD (DUF177 family)